MSSWEMMDCLHYVKHNDQDRINGIRRIANGEGATLAEHVAAMKAAWPDIRAGAFACPQELKEWCEKQLENDTGAGRDDKPSPC